MGKGGKGGKAAANNRANQMNPNNPAYASSRAYTKAMADNRANQLNPNNEAYEKSRGDDAAPDSDDHSGTLAWVKRTSPPPPVAHSGKGKCWNCGAEVTIHYPSASYTCDACGTFYD